MTEIHRILVANRGEIVSRVVRSAQRRGIEVVAVYAESDADALYTRHADYAINLGDDSSTSPYLDGPALVKAALATGCDAVHPGYGFLAENAAFARAVMVAGLVWIGPPPEAIDQMGGKIEAKQLAEAADVPVLDSVVVRHDDLDNAVLEAGRLKPPLLVKPSAGGGGKGMHLVEDLAALREVLRGAEREALASFGDGTLFIERYLASARHVEVQLVADTHGHVVHLGTRDCSVQRRHQKVVEEAPAPEIPVAILEKMCASSVELARQIGYTGVGTVEFLYFDEEFAFLEMNTRLQVEHAVTEDVTGLDLVDLQISISSGEILPFDQSDVTTTGHSVEVRLYAEDPTAGFVPSPGLITDFDVRDSDGVRWESGVVSGSPVNPRYDPMIAKVISYGRTRDEARKRLIGSLRHLKVGGIKTNRDMLIAVLGDADFAAARLDTRFLDDRPRLAESCPSPDATRAHVIAAILHGIWARAAADLTYGFAPPAWRNLRSQDALLDLTVDDAEVSVAYRPEGHAQWQTTIDGVTDLVRLLSVDSRSVEFELGSRRVTCQILGAAGSVTVWSLAGQTVVVDRTATPVEATGAVGSLRSPLPGIVVLVEAQVGDVVRAGQTLVVIEAMKMEHQIKAPEDGVVSAVNVLLGDLVDHGQAVAVVSAEGSDL